LVPRYTIFGHLCLLNGVVASSGSLWAQDRTLTTVLFGQLPVGIRPEKRLVFDVHVPGFRSASRLDVLSNGVLKAVSLQIKSPARRIPLDGILFAVFGSGRQKLKLDTTWKNYGRGYDYASVTLQDDLCVLGGLIRLRDWNVLNFMPTLGVLPTNCRPEPGNQLIFHVNSQELSVRVDVLPDGRLQAARTANVVGVVKAPLRPNAFLSLGGIAFTPGNCTSLEGFSTGWTAFGEGFRLPSYFLAARGKVCVLSGVLKKSPQASQTITVLPAGCRPTGTVAFAITHGEQVQRFEIKSTGELTYVAGPSSSSSWSSLDGIRFATVVAEEEMK